MMKTGGSDFEHIENKMNLIKTFYEALTIVFANRSMQSAVYIASINGHPLVMPDDLCQGMIYQIFNGCGAGIVFFMEYMRTVQELPSVTTVDDEDKKDILTQAALYWEHVQNDIQNNPSAQGHGEFVSELATVGDFYDEPEDIELFKTELANANELFKTWEPASDFELLIKTKIQSLIREEHSV